MLQRLIAALTLLSIMVLLTHGCTWHLQNLRTPTQWTKSLPAPNNPPSAQMADLHIHPFRIHRSCLEENQICDLPFGPTFPNRATFPAIKKSSLHLVVASFVKMEHAAPGLTYMREVNQASSPATRQKNLLYRFRLTQQMKWEIALAKWRIGLENRFATHCSYHNTQRSTPPSTKTFLKQMEPFGKTLPTQMKKAHEQKSQRDKDIKEFERYYVPGTFPKEELAPLRQALRKAHKTLWNARHTSYKLLCQYIKRKIERCTKAPGFQRKQLRIVYSAQEATQAINKGELAVVLGLEQIVYIHDKRDVAFYYDQGIRLSTLVHLSDNCLSGSADIAWDRKSIRFSQPLSYGGGSGKACVSGLDHPKPKKLKKPKKPKKQAKKDRPWRSPHLSDIATWNKNQGLTIKGVEVIKSMIRHGMIIDLAHLTESSVHQILACLQPNTSMHPPVLYSHTNFRGEKKGKMAEYGLSQKQLESLRKLKGMVGFGFHEGALKTLCRDQYEPKEPTLQLEIDPGDRGQMFLLSVMLRNIKELHRHAGRLAFGLDYNGGITPPAAFRSVASLGRLAQLIRQKAPQVYKSLSRSAPDFIELWKQVEKTKRWWSTHPSPVPFCPGKRFHTSCPWKRKTCG